MNLGSVSNQEHDHVVKQLEQAEGDAQGFMDDIARLTKALHAAKAHPDYTYIVAPAQSLVGPMEMEEGGWERNVDDPANNVDYCWRRKKE